jgi:hypothetical protein
MTNDMDSPSPWWHRFFDLTYAEIGLTDADPERVATTVEFLHRVLELGEGMRVFDSASPQPSSSCTACWSSVRACASSISAAGSVV